MDPVSMDLPTTTEPTFNSAHVVVNHDPTLPTQLPPPPIPNPTPTTHHPPYAEMITAAITALKEKEGSSRIAIAKYIDRVYTNLPPNHSALLTHNLKRLKNSGYLAMVKHSYMLAGSAPPPPPSPTAVDSNGTGGVGGDVSSALTKRKPGRPAKPKHEAQQPQFQSQDQIQAQYQAEFMAQQQAQQAQLFQQQQQHFIQQQQQQYNEQQAQFQPQMQFPPDPLLQHHPQFQLQQQPQVYPAPETQGYASLGAESVFVSLGLADGPVGVQNPAGSVSPAPGATVTAPGPVGEASTTKRRPGRPRKDGSTTVAKPVVPKLPNQSGTKRRPGRPARTAIVNSDATPSAASPKPRGRPRKSSTPGRRGRPKRTPIAAAAVGGNNATDIPAGGVPGGAIPTPKRRGRPPRSTYQGAQVAAVGVTDVPIAAAFDSENLPNAAVGGVTNGAPPPPLGKRRGRPPRSSSAAAVVKKPRRVSGKPLGRPRKNVAPAAVDTKLLVAYEELRGKFEHMQSKIKESVNMLKPCLNAETPAVALAALQELEELAAGGVNPAQQN